jgi:hypothetical protein
MLKRFRNTFRGLSKVFNTPLNMFKMPFKPPASLIFFYVLGLFNFLGFLGFLSFLGFSNFIYMPYADVAIYRHSLW